MNKVRVRFAPSPTGKLHIGGVRTALYNYLFAKKHGGDFILRIEDTDTDRFDPDAEAYILDALKWLGIMPNEGVGDPHYKQSARNSAGIYVKFVNKLVDDGKAYVAFDTPEELDAIRKDYDSKKRVFSYNCFTRGGMRNSLTMSPDETAKMMETSPYVIRMMVPKGEDVVFSDIVRGTITVKTNTLDDKVLWKSTGMPTYHLANVVDDHLMGITHVIRGEEWLPSAPAHVLLYKMFGFDMPAFAHLPLIMRPDGKGKLSKRDGIEFDFPVIPLEWKNPENGEVYKGYRESGYFPEAVLNILALLGWNPGNDIEMMSLDEMVNLFTLERVNKSGARYDLKKAAWFQKNYMLKRDPDRLAIDLMKDVRVADWWKSRTIDPDYLSSVCAAMKEKTSFVTEFYDMGKYFFETPATIDCPSDMIMFRDKFAAWIADVGMWGGILSHDTVRAAFDNVVASTGVDPRDAGKYLRDAITGMKAGPPIFDVISIIGASKSLERLGVKVVA